MYSKSSQGSRGSVQIKVSNGRLQLVFSHPVVTPSGELKNKRFYLSTRHDDTHERKTTGINFSGKNPKGH